MNTITTAVPFVSFENNARLLGLANAGVAGPRGEMSSAFYSNPALLQNDVRTISGTGTFMPWFRSLVPDISLSTFEGAYQLTERHALGLNLRYFSLGNIQFTDPFGNTSASFVPHEYCGQVNYSVRLSEDFDAGIAAKFIYSNLTGGQTVGGAESRPGITGAMDIGAVYRKKIVEEASNSVEVGAGASITNLGPKISYTSSLRKDFLPTNLNIGPYLEYTTVHKETDKIKVLVSYQATKYLVPTPPRYEVDASGTPVLGPNGNLVVAQGYDPNVPVAVALYQSFYDAPRGFEEELAEINHRFGTQFSYHWGFGLEAALRTGYFHESYQKGNRKFVTLGGGLGFKGFRFDIARIMGSFPGTRRLRGPLDGTMCFSMSFKQQLGKGKASKT